MPSSYSALKIELIATGEESGTWGNTTNTNLGTALEESIVGRATANFSTDADLTISLTDTNATQIARNYILNVTSSVSLSTTRNLIVPTINKPYIVENNTTGSQSIVVKTSAGTGVTIPNGKTMMVYADSTNVVPSFNAFAAGIGLVDPQITGTILEDVYTIVDGAAFEIDPGNGSIQLITLGANRTPKATNFVAGESITLMVDDGSAYAITWTDATWGGSGVVWLTDSGVAPTLAVSGYTAIVLWKVSTQVYGARVGDV